MKNYFVIHALGRTENDYWYKFIKRTVENKGYKCFVPTMPPIEDMSYDTWAKEFDKYKDFINEDSVFIGHSTGAIFIIRYLMENNLKIAKYISVVGFNKENPKSINSSWEEINKTFFVEDLLRFRGFAKEKISFYSPTDVYDFNPNSKSDLVQVGRERQERGEITPYFMIYHVIIPKNRKI